MQVEFAPARPFHEKAISHQLTRVNATEAFRLHQITHGPTRTKLGTLSDAEMTAKTLLSRYVVEIRPLFIVR